MLKLSVIGNLGSDPEIKYSATGTAMLRMNVAANYRVKGDGGTWEDRTEWVRVTVFGARAESLSNLMTKGMRVYVDGRLEARPWTTKDGELRAGLELVATDVEFASSRQDDAPRQPARSAASVGAPIPAQEMPDDGDDSLPF
jgi:single-strand DNA-binding protein